MNKQKKLDSIITGSDNINNGKFGMSIALSADGTIMAIGAPFRFSYDKKHNIHNSSFESVYIYNKVNDKWVQDFIITTEDSADTQAFGISVSLSDNGSILAIGSYLRNSDGITNSGAVYIYKKIGIAWIQKTIITAEDKEDNDCFGFSVSLS